MDNQKAKLSEQISDDLLSQCIHCGICLSVCPTYDITKLERSSPRGRIRLIKAFANNEKILGKIFEEEMSFCLGCRACETACPSGVKYDKIHISTKDILNRGFKFSFQKFIVKLFLNKILAHSSKLKFFSRLLFYYQNSWLRRFLHQTHLLRNISPKIFLLDEITPIISAIPSDEKIDEITFPGNNPGHNVAFHVGCIMNVAFAEINLDTIDLLKKSSCKIHTPGNQYCCGALHAHNGELSTAKQLARKNIDIFESINYNYLISNSAGCGSFMKEYSELLKDDIEYHEKAELFSSKIKDVTEFLTENNIKLNFKVDSKFLTYHDACHHIHGQGIFNQPREIISKINDCNFIEMEESTTCCGSAGIYNLLRETDSMRLLDKKMKNIIETNAKVVLTGNPGCLLQLKYGIHKYNKEINVKHIVTYLKEMT